MTELTPEQLAASCNEAVSGLALEYVDGVAPMQGYGTYTYPIRMNGTWQEEASGPVEIVKDQMYFRFRHDSAQLYVGPADPDSVIDAGDPVTPAHPPRFYAELHGVTGDVWAASLGADDLVRVMTQLVEELALYSADRPTHRDRLQEMLDEAVKIYKIPPAVSLGSVTEEDCGDEEDAKPLNTSQFGPVLRERAAVVSEAVALSDYKHSDDEENECQSCLDETNRR